MISGETVRDETISLTFLESAHKTAIGLLNNVNAPWTLLTSAEQYTALLSISQVDKI